MSKRKALFSKGSGELAEPNTFIGGVGATSVTSAADFAALTSLSESSIQNFSIDANNNVSFAVTDSSYTFNSGTFSNDTSIVYFIDADGLVTNNLSCRNATNLQYLYLPSCTSLGSDFNMDGVTGLIRVNYEGVTAIKSRLNLSDCESLEKLDLRSLNEIQNDTAGSLINLKGLKYFYLGALNNIASDQLQRILIRNIGRNPYFLYAGETSGDMKVYYNTSWGVQNQQAFTRCNSGWQIGDTCTINGLTYTAVDGTPTTDGEFNCAADQSNNQRQANFKTAINNDTRTGNVGDLAAASDNANMYIYCTTAGSAGNAITAVMGAGNTGTASFDWSPFQYGNDIYQALVDMRDIEGATMTEVDNIITVNAPSGLSASSITATTFTLNFTEPTANANGTETYEVWVEETNNPANPINYFYYQYVSGTGVSITGLEASTEYTIKVRTQDGQMQFSAFSSSISVTTNALTDHIFKIVGDEFKMSTNGLGYNYNIYWGDGTSDLGLTGASPVHSYSSNQEWTITVTGSFPRIYHYGNATYRQLVTEVLQWGDLNYSSTQDFAFRDCSNLTNIPVSEIGIFDGITSAQVMFGNTSITQLPDGLTLADLTNGSNMFVNGYLESLPSTLTCASLTSGQFMFYGNKFTTLPSGMTLDSLTLAQEMFRDSDLENLAAGTTLSNVTNGLGMFRGSNITSIPSTISLDSLTNGIEMFRFCTLDTTSYSNLLINTEANNSNNNVTFHGGNSQYNTSGQTARNALVNDHSWTITDGGLE